DTPCWGYCCSRLSDLPSAGAPEPSPVAVDAPAPGPLDSGTQVSLPAESTEPSSQEGTREHDREPAVLEVAPGVLCSCEREECSDEPEGGTTPCWSFCCGGAGASWRPDPPERPSAAASGATATGDADAQAVGSSTQAEGALPCAEEARRGAHAAPASADQEARHGARRGGRPTHRRGAGGNGKLPAGRDGHGSAQALPNCGPTASGGAGDGGGAGLGAPRVRRGAGAGGAHSGGGAGGGGAYAGSATDGPLGEWAGGEAETSGAGATGGVASAGRGSGGVAGGAGGAGGVASTGRGSGGVAGGAGGAGGDRASGGGAGGGAGGGGAGTDGGGGGGGRAGGGAAGGGASGWAGRRAAAGRRGAGGVAGAAAGPAAGPAAAGPAAAGRRRRGRRRRGRRRRGRRRRGRRRRGRRRRGRRRWGRQRDRRRRDRRRRGQRRRDSGGGANGGGVDGTASVGGDAGGVADGGGAGEAGGAGGGAASVTGGAGVSASGGLGAGGVGGGASSAEVGGGGGGGASGVAASGGGGAGGASREPLWDGWGAGASPRPSSAPFFNTSAWPEGVRYCFSRDAPEHAVEAVRNATGMLSKMIPCLVFHELPRSEHGNDDFVRRPGPHCGQTPSLFISTRCHPPHDCSCGPPAEQLPPDGRGPVDVPLEPRSGERLLNLGDPSCLHLELLMHELGHALASPAVNNTALAPNTVERDAGGSHGPAEALNMDVLRESFDLEGGATSPARPIRDVASALPRLLTSPGISVSDQLWAWALSRRGKSTIDVTQLVQIHQNAARPGAEQHYLRLGGERCLDTPLVGADLCTQLSDSDCEAADGPRIPAVLRVRGWPAHRLPRAARGELLRPRRSRGRGRRPQEDCSTLRDVGRERGPPRRPGGCAPVAGGSRHLRRRLGRRRGGARRSPSRWPAPFLDALEGSPAFGEGYFGRRGQFDQPQPRSVTNCEGQRGGPAGEGAGEGPKPPPTPAPMGGGRGSAARAPLAPAERHPGKAPAPPAAARAGEPPRRRGGGGGRASPARRERKRQALVGPGPVEARAATSPGEAVVAIAAACGPEVAPGPDLAAPAECSKLAARAGPPVAAYKDVEFEEGGDGEVAEAVERGEVLRMALDIRGCRLLQNAIELSSQEVQLSITRQLQGHVKEVLESPHANHVLQRAIEFMRPSSVSFVLEELNECGPAADLARHRYGCRIMERLIEHFPLGHLEPLITDMLNETWDLSKHPFGNFVVQHLLEHGTQDHRRLIVDCLLKELVNVCPHQHAVNVLDKALSYGALGDQRALAEGVLRRPGLLLQLSSSRAGLPAAQRLALVVKGGRLHEEAVAQLRTHLEDSGTTCSARAAPPRPSRSCGSCSGSSGSRRCRLASRCPRIEVAVAMALAPALPPTSTAGGRGARGPGGARGPAPCRARGGGRVA
ncbi:unnamed protein product, partial [Prorocentrum cordatum]